MKTFFVSMVFVVFVGHVLAIYSDSIARNKLLPAAAASYYNNGSAQQCVANNFPNGKLIRSYQTGFLVDVYSAATIVDNDARAIILAFGGSSVFTDLALVDPNLYFGNQTKFIGGGNVSLYIYNHWKSLWNTGIQDDILSAKNANPGYQVYITGHNIGGSFASLSSVYLLKLGFFTAGQIQLYTLGQPRTGDETYAQSHDQLLGANSFRVTHRQDPIPHIPRETDSGYIHHRNEVYYNNDMSPGQGFAECDADESSSCSDGNPIDISIDDHRHYFGLEVAKYGAAGCPKSS